MVCLLPAPHLTVTPAKAGAQLLAWRKSSKLDPRLRGDDESKYEECGCNL